MFEVASILQTTYLFILCMLNLIEHNLKKVIESPTEIGKKAGLFAKLQPGRARKRINAT